MNRREFIGGTVAAGVAASVAGLPVAAKALTESGWSATLPGGPVVTLAREFDMMYQCWHVVASCMVNGVGFYMADSVTAKAAVIDRNAIADAENKCRKRLLDGLKRQGAI